MAVKPVAFNQDGSIEVVHDGAGHFGTVQLGDFAYLQRDGVEDVRFLELACPEPGCNTVSLHPVSGGCAPEQIQRLFVLKVMAIQQISWTDAKQVVKGLIDAQEGLQRWRLENVDSAE